MAIQEKGYSLYSSLEIMQNYKMPINFIKQFSSTKSILETHLFIESVTEFLTGSILLAYVGIDLYSVKEIVLFCV